jgi:hypothetical protein
VQQVETTGASNAQVVPHCTDLLVGHCTTKQLQHPRTVTVWLQLVLLPQPSIIDHVSVMVTVGQEPLLTTTPGVTRILVLVPAMVLVQQVVTTGRSNDHAVPHCTDLLVGHCTTRQGQHPRTVTVWLQLVVLPQASLMTQFWVMESFGHAPLVWVVVGVMSTFVVVPGINAGQQDVATGTSNVHGVPHCTFLELAHCTCKQVLQHPVMVTTWVQLVELPQPSMIAQVCVTVTDGQIPFVVVPVGTTSTLVNTPVTGS